MDHKKKMDHSDRDRVIAGLREDGRGYRDIADLLGVSAGEVEKVLGEAGQLHAAGVKVRDIAQRIGLPRSSVQRLVSAGGARRRPAASSAQSSLAMTLLVDSYGLQLDLLGTFLNLRKNHTYQLVKDLRRDHLVVPALVQVQLGDKWVVPTGEAAASYLGWRPYTVWRPRPKDAEHYRAVAQARLMLAGTDLDAWISERQLRHDAAAQARQTRPRGRGGDPLGGAHIHDGRFRGVMNGTYGWWAIEVELSPKSRHNMDIALQGAIRAARAADPDPMTGLVYLCRGREVDNAVRAAVERLPAELAHLDMPLVFRDFDADWNEFAKSRRAMREATKEERLRNNPIRHRHTRPAAEHPTHQHTIEGRTQ